MADYPPPFNNWEAKQRAASKPRERVDSTSSYVVLRETAKHKQGVNSSKGNAKETKKRKTPKKEETSNRENRRNVTTSNRGHFQDKGRLEHRSCCRGLCFHRLLQFLVLFFSVAALALVILMVLGILGPADRCHACNKEDALPRAGKSSSKEPKENSNTSQTSQNTFSMDFSPFYDILEVLQANVTSLRKEAESIMKESERNKDALLAAKTDFNSTMQAITLFSNSFYAIVDHVNNSLQQFNHDDGLVFNRLRSLNTTLTNQLAETKQTYEQYNDVIDKKIESMNHTITEKVAIKVAEPGPIGARGQNGSKGPTGDAGQQGLQGPTGVKGLKGVQGDKGSTGDPGFPGNSGSKGETGDKGIKGQNGDNGPPGPQGDRGDQGSRGIGNFSWCQLTHIARTSLVRKVSVRDSQNIKVFGVSCSTSTPNAESNLQVDLNTNEYECECKSTAAAHSAANCVLYYWACPIQPP